MSYLTREKRTSYKDSKNIPAVESTKISETDLVFTKMYPNKLKEPKSAANVEQATGPQSVNVLKETSLAELQQERNASSEYADAN